jgi:hypothetical protein
MESSELVVESLRLAERILIAAGGILSVYLGYKLFYVSSLKEGSGSLKSSLFDVSLTKVGPGIFFALFGSFVMVTSLNASVSYQSTRTAEPTTSSNTQLVEASAKLLQVIDLTTNKLPDSPEKVRIQSSTKALQEILFRLSPAAAVNAVSNFTGAVQK